MNAEAMLKQAGCRLRTICDQRWDDFEDVGEPNIRVCHLCERLVFYTTTPEQLRSLAAAGQCAFIAPGSLVDEQDKEMANLKARIRSRGIGTKDLREPSVGMPITIKTRDEK